MIKLHGVALSNYYNKVKFLLLEHDIAFEEVAAPLPLAESRYAQSPAGKIPYLETEHGFLCESGVIVEYLAARFPEKHIFAADAWQAARERELIVFIETHLELNVRELYAEAFFGGTVSDEVKTTIEKRLRRYVAGFARLAKFAPYVAGDRFGVVDAAAFVSLPLVGRATQTIYGHDFLADVGIDWRAYLKLIGERPAAQRVSADRKTYIEANA
ncbi:glutathione S-transferase family protein [Paraburkholderia acidisoli]|uniref:Glutathione S-transferase n=1 Tax=Paraburkholderia acidisoli TaxID=2571748 RepID=A0A7Z2GGK3_9BURK|nr:glutathione S-transferase [Paraburkholderia acidisoli]QGZ61064.1 glutathione S-transferase [Paraburkholderia acidisoli]